jgi:hypothetical protein
LVMMVTQVGMAGRNGFVFQGTLAGWISAYGHLRPDEIPYLWRHSLPEEGEAERGNIMCRQEIALDLKVPPKADKSPGQECI